EEAPAVDVPQPRALAVRHDHGQRVVIAGAKGLFGVDIGRARFGLRRLAGVRIAVLHSWTPCLSTGGLLGRCGPVAAPRLLLGARRDRTVGDVDARTRLAAVGVARSGLERQATSPGHGAILPSKRRARPAAPHHSNRARMTCPRGGRDWSKVDSNLYATEHTGQKGSDRGREPARSNDLVAEHTSGRKRLPARDRAT